MPCLEIAAHRGLDFYKIDHWYEFNLPALAVAVAVAVGVDVAVTFGSHTLLSLVFSYQVCLFFCVTVTDRTRTSSTKSKGLVTRPIIKLEVKTYSSTFYLFLSLFQFFPFSIAVAFLFPLSFTVSILSALFHCFCSFPSFYQCFSSFLFPSLFQFSKWSISRSN